MNRLLLFSRLSIVFLSLAGSLRASGQQEASYRHALKGYEDNDLIKLFGPASDKGYTNGTRFDYYFVKDSSRFFLNKLMPKAGRQAVNTYGIGLMQTMYTPEDLHATEPDASDWPYTGALFLSYSQHSSNADKGYNVQTELIAGVMGPASLAEQLQTGVHKLINSAKPMGWDKQYPTDILLNLNLSLEKRLWQYNRWLDVTGGGQAMVGTMMDGASLYGLVRIGKMNAYFDGLLPQFVSRRKHRLQAYITARPSLEWVGYNAVIEGGVFAGRSDYYQNSDKRISSNRSVSRRLDLSAVLAYGPVSFSFTQRIMPRLLDGLNHERLGNISLYVAW
ncbi:lipid A deacylase LpxR family protein [Taibaiella koreensis]|uniref:lipid A deacylase LpxR family protein n=1 Tax=Taibaiella koreensis TaxID=1268548 RepID=UPI000E59B260|nr:lipid A deacylase LpxR family protein [Taibaiella koreensis]